MWKPLIQGDYQPFMVNGLPQTPGSEPAETIDFWCLLQNSGVFAEDYRLVFAADFPWTNIKVCAELVMWVCA